jgi:glutamate carboxypeptidase
MVRVTELHDRLKERQADMVDELGRYVSMESGSFDKEGVDHAGRVLSGAFEELGFTIERRPEEKLGDHLVARRPGSGQGRLLALIHLDTVWPRGTLAENPFRVENGRAYGPGVLDMRGGWIVLLSALRALRDIGWDGFAETVVVMTSDEEIGTERGRVWIEEEARHADWALVLERVRENGALVVQRSLISGFDLTVHGVTAHTQDSHRGASAIREIANKIEALEALTDRPRGIIINVGTVRGGTARQVVPEFAHAYIDLRAITAEIGAEVRAKSNEIVNRQYVPNTRAEIVEGSYRPPMEPNAGTEQLLALAQKCGSEIGIEVHGASSLGGSDGSFTAALGVPTLDGLGAEGAHSCSKAEYTILDSLPRRAALLAGMMTRLPDTL